jgi:glycosyltransferase involved in cell wall biosynthesis
MDGSIISEKMNGKNLSVIVPTYNGIEKLSSLLQSLEDQIVHGFEVIIVIDGSTDGSKQYLERYKAVNFELCVLFQQNSGRSKVRNAGVEKSKGDLLLFVDDDMRLKNDAIQHHLRHHEDYTESVLVGGQYLHCNSSLDFCGYRKSIEAKWYRKLSSYPKPMNADNLFITAAHLSLPRVLFDSVGGFDENLTDCEDEALGIQLLQGDRSVFFDGQIIGEHLDEKSCQQYTDRKKDYQAARIMLEKKFSLTGRKPNDVLKISEIFKAVIYRLLSFQIWVKLVDQELLLWIPKRIRYPLYSAIIHAVVKYGLKNGG